MVEVVSAQRPASEAGGPISKDCVDKLLSVQHGFATVEAHGRDAPQVMSARPSRPFVHAQRRRRVGAVPRSGHLTDKACSVGPPLRSPQRSSAAGAVVDQQAAMPAAGEAPREPPRQQPGSVVIGQAARTGTAGAREESWMGALHERPVTGAVAESKDRAVQRSAVIGGEQHAGHLVDPETTATRDLLELFGRHHDVPEPGEPVPSRGAGRPDREQRCAVLDAEAGRQALSPAVECLARDGLDPHGKSPALPEVCARPRHGAGRR